MGRTVIQNATIFDGTGKSTIKGDLVVVGNRVTSVGTTAVAQPDDITIDASGMFLMPGMVEGHAHLSFENVCATEDLITPCPETQVFTAARGAKALI